MFTLIFSHGIIDLGCAATQTYTFVKRYMSYEHALNAAEKMNHLIGVRTAVTNGDEVIAVFNGSYKKVNLNIIVSDNVSVGDDERQPSLKELSNIRFRLEGNKENFITLTFYNYQWVLETVDFLNYMLCQVNDLR